jgi:hypothetical protein
LPCRTRIVIRFVVDLERAHLADAQAGAVRRHDDGALLDRLDGVEQARDLAPTQDLWNPVSDLRPGDRRDDLGAPERDLVEELDPRDVHLPAGRARLLRLDQVHQELPDLQLAHLLRRLAVVGYECPRAVHVGLARPSGVVAKLKVFDHQV